MCFVSFFFFFFSSRRRHTRFDCDWSSDVCSSDLLDLLVELLDFALILDHPAAEGLFLLLLGLRAQDGALLDEVFFYLLEVFFLLIDELLADFDVLRQRILDLLAGLGAI